MSILIDVIACKQPHNACFCPLHMYIVGCLIFLAEKFREESSIFHSLKSAQKRRDKYSASILKVYYLVLYPRYLFTCTSISDPVTQTL